MADLQALNPRAETLEVRCRPSQIPDSVQVWAVQAESGHVVTDEQPDELQSVAPLASVFIQVNQDAPYENAEIMASRYGLVCPNMVQDSVPESESLRQKEPCPADVSQSNGSPNLKFMADPGKPDCNPQAPANAGAAPSTAPKSLPRIAVCAHPTGITSNEWHGGPGIKAGATNQADYDAQIAKATVVFYFDASAPPESIWYFGPNEKARCPGKAPIPYDQWVAKNSGTKPQKTSSTSSETPAPSPTTITTTPHGAGKTTETSSPTGKGPPLSTFETLARNMNLLAAVANADTSGNAKHPEGHRNGMVNGTNVGGWSFPALQAGLSAIQILTAVGLSPKAFVERIAAATKGGQRVLINEADKAALHMADELIKEAGQYELAKGLQEISAVLPFKLGQKFTASLESKFQAHKIFEKQAFEHFTDVFGKKELQEAIEKAPSVILTDVEHQAITKELNKFWRYARKENLPAKQVKKELLELYQRVYKDHPHWLQAIQHLFNQIP